MDNRSIFHNIKEVRKKRILGSDPASGPAPEVKWIRSGPRHILRPSFLEMDLSSFRVILLTNQPTDRRTRVKHDRLARGHEVSR